MLYFNTNIYCVQQLFYNFFIMFTIFLTSFILLKNEGENLTVPMSVVPILLCADGAQ